MKNKIPNLLKINQLEFNERVSEFLFVKFGNLERSIKDKRINVALSGGNTPLPILRLLKNKKLNWERFNFFMVDERCVSIRNSASNFGNIKKVFFNNLSSSFFSVIQNNLSLTQSINYYKEMMLNNINITEEGLPQFDLILLGMGDDGHTASLFPGTIGLKENKEWVILNKIPQLQKDRITLTYPVLLNAKDIVVIVKGDSKKKIIKELYSNSTTKYPMQKIVDEFENLNWLIG